ncbi:MAG: hypothetical protein ACYDGR_12810 [Candidatus Dormibacteria bacterium]
MIADEYRVFVPAPGSRLERELAHGSGIVGSHEVGGRVLIDYDGAIYGQSGMARWADRVLYAADRHGVPWERAPTIARQSVSPSEVIEVGTWAPRLLRITLCVTPAGVRHWVDVETDPKQLYRTGYELPEDLLGLPVQPDQERDL